MSEERIAALMRQLVQSLGKTNVDRALDFFADDAVWEVPEGTFRGKDQIRRYLRWMAEGVPDLTITESGVGIVVQGDRAAFEHTMRGTVMGKPCTWVSVCTYEFSGDKVKRIRTAQDRLSLAQQAAPGGFTKMIVNQVVKRAEKGLR